MKKYSLLIIWLLAFQSSVAQNDATFVEPDKITVSLLTYVSFFKSANVGYEKQLGIRRSLETELAFIYSSVNFPKTKGIIWRNTYKFFEIGLKKRRAFIGPQLVLHYNRTKHEGVFSHLSGLYFERDDLIRYKFRASLMGVLGEEMTLSKKLFLEVNAGLGIKYDAINISSDNLGEYVFRSNTINPRRRENRVIFPDANIAFKLKYNLS